MDLERLELIVTPLRVRAPALTQAVEQTPTPEKRRVHSQFLTIHVVVSQVSLLASPP
jgi:hypothetical protein